MPPTRQLVGNKILCPACLVKKTEENPWGSSTFFETPQYPRASERVSTERLTDRRIEIQSHCSNAHYFNLLATNIPFLGLWINGQNSASPQIIKLFQLKPNEQKHVSYHIDKLNPCFFTEINTKIWAMQVTGFIYLINADLVIHKLIKK